MKLKLILLLSSLTGFACLTQASAQQKVEPTNEEIITFLDKTTDLADATQGIEITFVIQKGDCDQKIWHNVIANTAAYIKQCLRDDDRAISDFAPFIKIACDQLEKHNLHGNIAIDFTDCPEDNTVCDQQAE